MKDIVYAEVVECPSNEEIEEVNENDVYYENTPLPFNVSYKNGTSMHILGNHIIILGLLPDESIDIPFDKVMMERTIEIFQDVLDREVKE